jgi:3'(2'), 5'-bisphosphate nucleotidase
MTTDARLARDLADAAGAALTALRGSTSLTGRELKDEGDRVSQQALSSLLAQHRPDDAVLSEEATDSSARLNASRVWIIDPLDGTREFSEVPRTDWAVHVALWQDGDLVAGAVARPASGLTYATDEPLHRPTGRPARIRLAVSRTRPPAFVAALGEILDAELVPMGSAGIKAMAVLADEVDAYVHAGGQFEWDSAAPVAVARAAGLHTSRIDGSPLVYNRPDPTLPDLVICRPEIADEILAAISRLTTTKEESA